MSEEVELWLEPINNGKNAFPIVCVGDQAFIYSNKGLDNIPKYGIKRPEKWKKLGKYISSAGKTAVEIAFEIYAEKFLTYDPEDSNPVQFAKCFCKALLTTMLDSKIWDKLMNQDWEGIAIDTTKMLHKSSGSSFSSSY
uniref:CSON006931 protein n=1 Tax=Culicoides sonorensis TaxID=179676 RepID=A0A336MYM4_CULSO